MLAIILVFVRALTLACRGHHELVLENLALRQQLNAFKRRGTRPQLRTRDRLFWIVLAKTWRHWRAPLVLVQPDTVVRWHREWLRRRWTRRSARVGPGRPATATAIRTLVNQMATANPLWGAPRIHGELGKLGVGPGAVIPVRNFLLALAHGADAPVASQLAAVQRGKEAVQVIAETDLAAPNRLVDQFRPV